MKRILLAVSGLSPQVITETVLDKESNIAELYKKHLAPYCDHEGMSVRGYRDLRLRTSIPIATR